MDCLCKHTPLFTTSAEGSRSYYVGPSKIAYHVDLSMYGGRAGFGCRFVNLSQAVPAEKRPVLNESQAMSAAAIRVRDRYCIKGSSITPRGVQTVASARTTSTPESVKPDHQVRIDDQSVNMDNQFRTDSLWDSLYQMKQFYIPELRCFFPVKYHPDYEEITEEVNTWLLEWKRPRTEEEREFLLQSDLHGVVCLTIPESQNKQRMLRVCKLATWLSAFDDESDQTSQSGADFKAVNEVQEHLKRVLWGQDSNEDPDRPDIKAICSVLRQLRADMSPEIHGRHADTLTTGLFSFAEQASVRESSGVLDIPTYISTRRRTFLFNHIKVMIQYCLGVELDDEILQMDCMQELHNAAGDYTAWTNDLISFRREYFQGDFQNLLCVVYLNSGGKLDFQQAVYKVCDMIRARERDFFRIFHEISLSDLAARNPDLRVYLRNLPYVLSGHLHWYYTSARFHGVGNCMVKMREGMLQMIPDKSVLLPSLQDAHTAAAAPA